MEAKDKIDAIHSAIDEVEITESQKTYRVLKDTIKKANRDWIIEFGESTVKQGEITVPVYELLIANKLTELSKTMDLDNQETFASVANGIRKKFELLLSTKRSYDPIVKEPLILENGKEIDCFENLEYYIAELDKDYPDKLTDIIDKGYISYKNYEEGKEKREKREAIEYDSNLDDKELEEAEKTIKLINNTLEEEKEIDPDMAFRIQKYIEFENKQWMLQHRDDQTSDGISVKDYIIANKLTEIRDPEILQDETVFRAVYNMLSDFYDNINKDNLNDFKNLAKIGDKTYNCTEKLEEYIIKLDPSYASYLSDKVDWFYENYKKHEAKPKEEDPKTGEPIAIPASSVVTEEPETREPVVEENKKVITTLDEWVAELGKCVVVDNKLVRRK